jgi:carbamoyl-phosphate synthase small subunit
MREKQGLTKSDIKTRINRPSTGDFLNFIKARLDLSDGTLFNGQVPAWQTGSYCGEVVFNTGMTGYVESLTDPSYSGQMLVFTFPLIGNYGVDMSAAESDKIQVSGVVISGLSENPSHSKSELSLLEWLYSQNIPIITGVDTRALTKHLRVKGNMAGAIGTSLTKPKDMKLTVKIISIKKPEVFNKGKGKKVVLVDCGAKENILRSLCALPMQVTRVPHDYDYTNDEYDGVVLSNGPGDPENYKATIAIAKKALSIGKPIFGICLGTQIMAIAAGAKTYRLKFGHRGHNQPCMDLATERCYITSQNHGYAIDEKSLPKGWKISFKNLNDGSVEGIQHATKPFFSVQFHPEAAPGPTDTAYLFERFYKSL